MKTYKNIIISFFCFNIFFVVALLLIKHAWLISVYENVRVNEIYPRIYYVLEIISENSFLFFLVLFLSALFLNLFFVYKVVSLYKDRKTAILFFISLAFILFIAELSLRAWGVIPGMHTWVRYFKPVEELWEYKGYVADEHGIFKVSSEAADEVARRIAANNKSYDPSDKSREYTEVYSLAEECLKIINGEWGGEFGEKYNEILIKAPSQYTSLDSAFLEYIKKPINKEGFKSIPFKPIHNDKPSVLLLGDSFTWGHSTTNKTDCFADILLSRGYAIYNTGISATDVAQYLAVARKYIPEIKPDYVIVNFYIGNDVTYYQREIKPYHPVFYCTNAGNILACPEGEYLANKDIAYEFALSHLAIPESENLFNAVMAKTAMTSLLWKIIDKSFVAPYLNERIVLKYRDGLKGRHKKPFCNIELKEIEKIAQENGCKFIISSIPSLYRFSETRSADIPYLFEGMDYVEMAVDKDLYNLGDGHFNDAGHKKYADFLDSLISAQ